MKKSTPGGRNKVPIVSIGTLHRLFEFIDLLADIHDLVTEIDPELGQRLGEWGRKQQIEADIVLEHHLGLPRRKK